MANQNGGKWASSSCGDCGEPCEFQGYCARHYALRWKAFESGDKNRTCTMCGGHFVAEKATHVCCKKCTVAHGNRRRAERKRSLPPSEHECEYCHGAFFGRKKKYCSLECRRAAVYRASRERTASVPCRTCGSSDGSQVNGLCRPCYAREYHYEREFGLPYSELAKVKELQAHQCPICLEYTPDLAFDHSHVTDLPRGWLTHNCNQGLGHFGDDKLRLIRGAYYLCNEEARIMDVAMYSVDYAMRVLSEEDRRVFAVSLLRAVFDEDGGMAGVSG
jgi:hypothetical protein